MQPDLRHLRYFVAVAEEESFTRAAARLSVTQQAVSEQVRSLEAQLGAPLLERGPRGVALTAVGAAFLPEARAVLARAEHALEVAGRAARGELGTLRVGFLSTTANLLLPPVVRAFRARFPDVALQTVEVSIGRLVAELRDSRLDAGVARPPLVDDLASETVLRERAAAVLPEGHPLAGRAELALADLADEPWVMLPPGHWPPWHRGYLADFRAAGYEPRVVEWGTSVQNVLALVAAGLGVARLAISSRTLRRSGVVFVPLRDDWTDTVVLWRPGAAPPALEHLREVVRDVARDLDPAEAG